MVRQYPGYPGALGGRGDMYGDMPRNGGADTGVSCPTPDPPDPGATIPL